MLLVVGSVLVVALVGVEALVVIRGARVVVEGGRVIATLDRIQVATLLGGVDRLVNVGARGRLGPGKVAAEQRGRLRQHAMVVEKLGRCVIGQ